MLIDLNESLRANPYPGRGILLGRSADGGKAVIAYFIMCRSENSPGGPQAAGYFGAAAIGGEVRLRPAGAAGPLPVGPLLPHEGAV